MESSPTVYGVNVFSDVLLACEGNDIKTNNLTKRREYNLVCHIGPSEVREQIDLPLLMVFWSRQSVYAALGPWVNISFYSKILYLGNFFLL